MNEIKKQLIEKITDSTVYQRNSGLVEQLSVSLEKLSVVALRQLSVIIELDRKKSPQKT